jgi:hypothetical protein
MGCQSSKDGANPKSKQEAGGSTSSPQKGKAAAEGRWSVAKMNIKKVTDEHVKDVKLADILSFVKSGKVDMVHAIINYYKISFGVMNLRPDAENFTVRGKQYNTKDFNPLLYAIANK